MRLDEYRIPDLGFSTAKTMVQIIDDRLGGVVTPENEEELALALGHTTAESGAFRSKLTDLKTYGLIEQRGDKNLTPIAVKSLNNESNVVLDIINNIDLFEESYQKFGDSLPAFDEWEAFLDEKGIENPGGGKAKTAWERYNELARTLSQKNSTGKTEEDVLDKEREFDYYVQKLENPNTREHAVNVLRSNLKKKQLPDSDPLDEILSIIENEKYPKHQSDFLDMLERICHYHDLDGLDEEKRQEVVNLAYDKLDDYSNQDNISDQFGLATDVLDVLEALKPTNLIDKWWEILADKLLEAAIEEDDDLRYFVRNELGNRLMSGNDYVSDRFYAEKADAAEDWLWDTMATSEDEQLQQDCEYLLNKMGVR